jgi:hypothetical protein
VWPSYPASLVSNVTQSNFIFRGVVTRLNASTVSSLPGDGLYVVKVEQAFLSNDFSDQFIGQEVTINPAGGSINVQVGDEADYFTTSWVDGDGIALSEIAHTAAGADPSIASDVPAIVQWVADRALYEDMKDAIYVLLASVDSVGNPIGEPVSEHDPLWADAQVTVQQTLLDDANDVVAPSSAVIRFPSSNDIAWYAAPKLTAGQTAILIVHQDSGDDAFSARGAGGSFTGVVYRTSPSDLRDPSEQAHLLSLLACPPPPVQ